MDFSRLLCVVCLLGSPCFSSFATAREPLSQLPKTASINPQWEGRYTLRLEGETLNDGSTVSRTWDIKIDPVSSTANIDITTWHAPYSCRGDYVVQDTGATLLFTHRDEHEECIYSAPQFEMKKQSDGFYVKGKMFDGDENQWQRLVKRNPRVDALIQKLDRSSWKYESVTAGIVNGESGHPESFYKQTLGDKPISVMGNEVRFSDDCRLSFSPYFQKPINYYHSAKSVEFYTALFTPAGIQMPEELTLLATKSSSGECIIDKPEFIYLGNKLAFFYEDKMVIYSRVDGATAAKSVIEKCESVPQNSDEYHSQTRCFYPAMSLEETYKRYNSENLVPTLKPGEDFVIEKLGDTDSVEYTWDGSQVLKIKQNFPGGITEFLFVADKSGTTVTKNDYPD